MKRPLLVVLVLLLWPLAVVIGAAAGGFLAGVGVAKTVADLCAPGRR